MSSQTQIVVLNGPDKGKTGKLIGMDGDSKGACVGLHAWARHTSHAHAHITLSATVLPKHKHARTAVVKLDTNGAFTEVKIIATTDVGKQLQDD